MPVQVNSKVIQRGSVQPPFSVSTTLEPLATGFVMPSENRYMQLDDLGKGTACAGLEILAGGRFETPWRSLNYVELAPGKGFRAGAAEWCEHGFIVIEGVVECVSDGVRTGVEGPAALLAGPAREHTVNNVGTETVRLVHMSVALGAAVRGDDSLRVESVDPQSLEWRASIHQGVGRIATRHLWGPGDFNSSWTFVDHAVLESRSSVGYHYHEALEECFLVLKGSGLMTIDDETFAVGPNSVTWQGIETSHGIYNPAAEELEFLRLAVAKEDEDFTTIDLHDDLSGRRPGR